MKTVRQVRALEGPFHLVNGNRAIDGLPCFFPPS